MLVHRTAESKSHDHNNMINLMQGRRTAAAARRTKRPIPEKVGR